MKPKILEDIEIALSEARIRINEKVEGEGRGGSLKDEGSVKAALRSHSKLKNHIHDVPPRRFGDMLVQDYDGETFHVVNIKTSIGSSDNAFSKAGFLYAFTDIKYEDIPGQMGWDKWLKLLNEYRDPNVKRDYWFLCVDKNNSSDVLIRGARQIANYGENPNPNNLLQINWKKEKEVGPVDRTYDEAYDVCINGVKRCYKKHFESLPREMTREFNFI